MKVCLNANPGMELIEPYRNQHIYIYTTITTSYVYISTHTHTAEPPKDRFFLSACVSLFMRQGQKLAIPWRSRYVSIEYIVGSWEGTGNQKVRSNASPSQLTRTAMVCLSACPGFPSYRPEQGYLSKKTSHVGLSVVKSVLLGVCQGERDRERESGTDGWRGEMTLKGIVCKGQWAC